MYQATVLQFIWNSTGLIIQRIYIDCISFLLECTQNIDYKHFNHDIDFHWDQEFIFL